MKTILVILSVLTTTQLFSQIPNGSFESWEQKNTWEVPRYWSTNNADMDFVSVTKVESITDGDYAMKVESKGTSFEGFAPGIAQTSFKPATSFNTLEFSYQIDSIIAGGNIEIVVSQYIENAYVQIGYWKQETATSGIQFLQLPLNSVNEDSIKIVVRANSHLTELGYVGHADITVDKMDLSMTSSTTNHPSIDDVFIYPNPTNKQFTINRVKNNTPFLLYNFEGQLIKSGLLIDNIVEIDTPGEYNLILQIEDTWVVKKVVVKK